MRLRRVHFHHHFAGLLLGPLANNLRQLAHRFHLRRQLDVFLPILRPRTALRIIVRLRRVRVAAALALGRLLLAFALALLIGGLVRLRLLIVLLALLTLLALLPLLIALLAFALGAFLFAVLRLLLAALRLRLHLVHQVRERVAHLVEHAVLLAALILRVGCRVVLLRTILALARAAVLAGAAFLLVTGLALFALPRTLTFLLLALLPFEWFRALVVNVGNANRFEDVLRRFPLSLRLLLGVFAGVIGRFRIQRVVRHGRLAKGILAQFGQLRVARTE